MRVLRRLVGIANPIIKACLAHRMGDNTRIDRRPPAHLNCAPLLQYKRQREQIPLIRPPQCQFTGRAMERALSPLPELERGGDDKNFLIKGRECSISF